MIIQKAFKYRLYPNAAQQKALAVQFGCARFVWNEVLALRTLYYKDNRAGFGYEASAGLLVWLKEQYPWLTEAHSQVLQQKLKDQQTAFDNFFRRLKRGEKPGYPKPKKKRGRQAIRYPQPPAQPVKNGKICLSKVGNVRIVLHRPFEGQVKHLTVSQVPSGAYFVSILCEVERPDVPLSGPAVGIDLGLKTFAVFSNDEVHIETPRHFRQSEKKLAQLQRKLARQVRGSKRYIKTKRRVARLHEHVANQRQDFHHQWSAYLTGQYGFIGVEDLSIKGLARTKLSKSILDAGWSQFVSFLHYKGVWYGCRVQQVDRWFPSSRRCGRCGWINKELTLADRFWTCPECGATWERDQNAASNILKEALRLAG